MLVPIFAISLLGNLAPGPSEKIYVGAKDGIYTTLVNSSGFPQGNLTRSVAATTPNFLVLSADGKFIYTIESVHQGDKVGAYAVGANGGLTLLNTVATGQDGGCHVTLSHDGKTLLLANYTSATVQSFRITADGRIGALVSTIPFSGSGPNIQRQAGPHAHSIYPAPDSDQVYACDLGSDRIWIFHLSTDGRLVPAHPAFASCPPGSGPRHLVFSPDGKFVYVADEMGVGVSVFTRDATTGALTLQETVPCLPPNLPTAGVTTSEIMLGPDGHRLYVANRSTDNLSIFAVADDGRLSQSKVYPFGPALHTPRSVALEAGEHWLVAAGQDSNSIGFYQDLSGRISRTGAYLQAPTPMCVIIAPVRIAASSVSRNLKKINDAVND